MHIRLLLPTVFVLGACANEHATETSKPTPISDTQTVATDACPVLDSRGWEAWVDKMPGPNDGARLHVIGEVDTPTPGYSASWSLGLADRAMPPGQHLNLALSPPEEMTVQVVTALPVHYEGEAVYPKYRSIIVRCGDRLLAEISPVPEVQ